MKPKKFRTHYDNLKVGKNATTAEIRAAYRRLSLLYHPDRNTHPEALEIMQLINQAYTVLSDDKKRRAHDQWILEQSHKNRELPKIYAQKPKSKAWKITALTIFFATLLLGALITLFISKPDSHQLLITQFAQAPNGASWPIQAAYIDGYPVLMDTASAQLTINNKQGQSAVFVQLYTLKNDGQGALRSFFIPTKSSFTLNNLNEKNSYFIRYLKLLDGSWHQSSLIDVQVQTNYRLPE